MPGVIPLLLTEEAPRPAPTVGGGRRRLVTPWWEWTHPALTYLEFLELLGVEDDETWRLLYEQMYLAN